MAASEAIPCVRGLSGPLQELELGARSAIKLYLIVFKQYLISITFYEAVKA